jgi:hypothetical protein
MAAYGTYTLRGGGTVTGAQPSASFDLDAAYPQRRTIIDTAWGVASLAVVPEDSGRILILDERRSGKGLTLFGFDATPESRRVLEEILAALRDAWRTERSETGGGAEPGVSPTLLGWRRRSDKSAAAEIKTKH